MSPDRRSHLIAWALLGLAALLWAGNFVLGRAVRADIPPVGLAFWRWLVAFVVILPFTWRELWKRRAAIRRHAPVLFALGLSGVGTFNSLSYIALSGTQAINAMLSVSLVPLAVLVAAFLLDNERPGAARLAGIAVSIAGIVMIAARGDPRALLGLDLNPYDLVMLGAVLGWGIYTVLLRRIPRGLFSPLGLVAVTVGFGLVLLLPSWLIEASFFAVPAMRFDTTTVLSVLYAALAASLAGYLAWNAGVGRIGPAAAAPLIHLQPVLGTILAILLLNEQPRWFHLAGFAMVLGGVAIASLTPPAKPAGRPA